MAADMYNLAGVDIIRRRGGGLLTAHDMAKERVPCSAQSVKPFPLTFAAKNKIDQIHQCQKFI